jgi:hypothetical protein
MCKTEIEKWLSGIGLELKPSKTRLAHTLNKLEDEEPGFNFLGFNIRQFPVGKYNSGSKSKSGLLGFKTIITPSKESQKRHYRKAVTTSLMEIRLKLTILFLHPWVDGTHTIIGNYSTDIAMIKRLPLMVVSVTN